tara:strand:- start:902 stop:1249 length:348 start_codon:yes stop_codon:yes gene_type:complete
MSYESWRISHQSSEQAARSAYQQLEAVTKERDVLAKDSEEKHFRLFELQQQYDQLNRQLERVLNFVDAEICAEINELSGSDVENMTPMDEALPPDLVRLIKERAKSGGKDAHKKK